jgi:radical SAM protein with 4Fe4S-binding SPASM domain
MEFIRRHSTDYNFVANVNNGMTMRWGKTLDENPYKAPLPELVDISISNHCTKGCSFCYRNSIPNNHFMSVDDYEFVLKSMSDERWGNVFQVALGGGEPLEHPDFIEILKNTRKYNVVPNFTTNAMHITKEIATQIKPLVGAVAISFPNILTIPISKAHIFIEEGIKTNIHFLLDRKSVKQGIEILEGKYNDLLKGFNSIIFLTFKPMGRGREDLCLELNDDLKNFCRLIDKHNCNLNIGFDSCFMPMLMHFTNTTIDFIEPCECAFFSAYVDENLNVKPCSFTNHIRDTYSLKEKSFSEIWNIHWDTYRDAQKNTCERECKNSINCRGGCPYYSLINLCKTDKPAKLLV